MTKQRFMAVVQGPAEPGTDYANRLEKIVSGLKLENNVNVPSFVLPLVTADHSGRMTTILTWPEEDEVKDVKKEKS